MLELLIFSVKIANKILHKRPKIWQSPPCTETSPPRSRSGWGKAIGLNPCSPKSQLSISRAAKSPNIYHSFPQGSYAARKCEGSYLLGDPPYKYKHNEAVNLCFNKFYLHNNNITSSNQEFNFYKAFTKRPLLSILQLQVSHSSSLCKCNLKFEGIKFEEKEVKNRCPVSGNLENLEVTKTCKKRKRTGESQREGRNLLQCVSSEPWVFKENPKCIYCGAVRMPYESPKFCCGDGKIVKMSRKYLSINQVDDHVEGWTVLIQVVERSHIMLDRKGSTTLRRHLYTENRSFVVNSIKAGTYKDPTILFSPPADQDILDIETALAILKDEKTAWVKGTLKLAANHRSMWFSACGNCQKSINAPLDWNIKCPTCNQETTGRSTYAEVAAAIGKKEVICFVRHYSIDSPRASNQETGSQVGNHHRYTVIKLYTAEETQQRKLNHLVDPFDTSGHGKSIANINSSGSSSQQIAFDNFIDQTMQEKQCFSPTTSKVLEATAGNVEETSASKNPKPTAKRPLAYTDDVMETDLPTKNTCTTQKTTRKE
ncbi:F-box and associated interaction domains-containing protein [Striga asiatica]|uniref:F-box and associated interaction domains-containing protein n=1 Tax=Striga asiatica TaxID=4170 RepID=A0A5A7P6F8_STRAF|nr:F-box and associated interaction domains-containing protein [Striga asiatica]